MISYIEISYDSHDRLYLDQELTAYNEKFNTSFKLEDVKAVSLRYDELTIEFTDGTEITKNVYIEPNHDGKYPASMQAYNDKGEQLASSKSYVGNCEMGEFGEADLNDLRPFIATYLATNGLEFDLSRLNFFNLDHLMYQLNKIKIAKNKQAEG